ncbi:uncharacterized protein LOC134814654 [Bolinopsis microptera]|uniref:uncharacterized protein LOC134814654 n=1 Tax=Bolinopsis microptera TaxID=2820187 RepID=UPI00307A1ECB
MTADPISCTHHCPDGYLYELNGTLQTSGSVSCNSSTAQWSHMSRGNPLGELPKCAASITPTHYLTFVDMSFLGSESCPDISKTQLALTTYFSGSSSDSYSCIKGENPACSITEVKCSSSSTSLKITYNVKQTGDLKIPVETFSSQITADVKSKNLKLTVNTVKRRKRAIELTGDTSEISGPTARCEAGAGYVGTVCVKCPIGRYEKDGVCTDCPANTFSNTVGSTKCNDCSDDLKTITTGSDSESDCTALCKVPDMVNGYSYPASGYTVSDKTTVYTHCKDYYSVQHNILQSRPCGQLDSTKPDFPNCYRMCKIVHISDSMSVTDKSVEINSLLAYKEPANFTCNDEKDTAICANAGQNVSLYCNKVSIILLLAIIAGGTLLLTVTMVTVYFLCCISGKKKGMARREETAVEPMLKLNVGLGGVFRGLDEQTYNLADQRSDEDDESEDKKKETSF